jgi:hypothetical protein
VDIQSILNLVPLEIKTEIYLLILLPDKFGYLIIWVQVRSRPNNIVDVANTKLEHYLVKKLAFQLYLVDFLG